MERKGRKMLALGAVIMLCAVAIIGAGYAAFSNTNYARTYNEGNSTVAGYMTITPGTTAAGDWTAISTNVNNADFSTYTYNSGTQSPVTSKAYYFTSGGSEVNIGTQEAPANYIIKELGSSKSFYVENQTGGALTSVVFGAKASAAAGNADFKYFLKVVGGSTTAYIDVDNTEEKTATLTLSSVADGGNTTITVTLCIGYQVNGYVPNDYIGNINGTEEGKYDIPARCAPTNAPADMNSVSFAFSLKSSADIAPTAQ